MPEMHLANALSAMYCRSTKLETFILWINMKKGKGVTTFWEPKTREHNLSKQDRSKKEVSSRISGACIKTLYPNSPHLCQVIKNVYGVAWCWWWTTPFRPHEMHNFALGATVCMVLLSLDNDIFHTLLSYMTFFFTPRNKIRSMTFFANHFKSLADLI